MEKIKVCLVDDNKELVSMLESYVAAQDDMEVIGTVYNGQECLNLLTDKQPDVLCFRHYYATLRWFSCIGENATY